MRNKNLLIQILIIVLAIALGIGAFWANKNLNEKLSLNPRTKKDIVKENPFPSGLPKINENVIQDGEE